MYGLGDIRFSFHVMMYVYRVHLRLDAELLDH